MNQRNNLPVKYKARAIWTNARLLRSVTLLLMGDLRRVDSSCNIILKPYYIDFDFESIFHDELDLERVKASIARMNGLEYNDLLVSNNLGHLIGSILKSITPDITNKELSKEVTEITNIRPEAIKELLVQIGNLLNDEEPFTTDKHVSMNYLLGEWESKNIVDALDFDINFNMTDFSPLQKVILRISHGVNDGYLINVSVPAMDWTKDETLELKLIDGSVLLDKGMLEITDFVDSRTHRMPIIRADNGQLESYLYKTKIIFERDRLSRKDLKTDYTRIL